MLRVIVFASILSILFVMSCAAPSASQEQVSPGSSPIGENKTTVQGKLSWEDEWARTVREAQKEGSVVIYTGGAVSPAIKAAMSVIKKKYGIDVETVAGRALSTRQR